MKKPIIIIIIAVCVVVLAGVITFALFSVTAPKNDSTSQPAQSQDKEIRADKIYADAEDLINDTVKLGNTEESDKKTEEAIAKFNEASKLYEQAGNKNASIEADANAKMLASRVLAGEKYKKQQAEEQAKEQAAIEAGQE